MRSIIHKHTVHTVNIVYIEWQCLLYVLPRRMESKN